MLQVKNSCSGPQGVGMVGVLVSSGRQELFVYYLNMICSLRVSDHSMNIRFLDWYSESFSLRCRMEGPQEHVDSSAPDENSANGIPIPECPVEGIPKPPGPSSQDSALQLVEPSSPAPSPSSAVLGHKSTQLQGQQLLPSACRTSMAPPSPPKEPYKDFLLRKRC